MVSSVYEWFKKRFKREKGKRKIEKEKWEGRNYGGKQERRKRRKKGRKDREGRGGIGKQISYRPFCCDKTPWVKATYNRKF